VTLLSRNKANAFDFDESYTTMVISYRIHTGISQHGNTMDIGWEKKSGRMFETYS